jgi:hypothetical protein
MNLITYQAGHSPWAGRSPVNGQGQGTSDGGGGRCSPNSSGGCNAGPATQSIALLAPLSRGVLRSIPFEASRRCSVKTARTRSGVVSGAYRYDLLVYQRKAQRTRREIGTAVAFMRKPYQEAYTGLVQHG